MERQRVRRKETKNEFLTVIKKTTMSTIRQLERDLAHAQGEISKARAEIHNLRDRLQASQLKCKELQSKLVNCLGEKWKYNKCCKRAAGMLAHAVERSCQKALKDSAKISITKRGIYTAQAHQIARFLVSMGCSEKKVGRVIQSVGVMMGMMIKKRMSQRTVQRCITEGGLAAKMQAGHEMVKAKGTSAGLPG